MFDECVQYHLAPWLTFRFELDQMHRLRRGVKFVPKGRTRESNQSPSSDEMQLLRRCKELVAEFGMGEADQRVSALSRGQALEVCRSELGDDIVRVDARSRDRPLEPIAASPSPQTSIDNDRRSLSGQVPQSSPVGAVARFGLCAATRTGRWSPALHGDRPSVLASLDAQDVQAGRG